MSEKATLLTTIPPVKKTEAASSSPTLLSPTPPAPKEEGSASLLSAVPEVPKDAGRVSLLSQTKEAAPAPKPVAPKPVTSKPVTQKPVLKPVTEAVAEAKSVEGVETVASEAVAEESDSITTFQMLTYASFVLNFLLAGAVAVVLFKKAAKLAEERFIISAKALGIASVLIMLHGFFATYLYSSYLGDSVGAAPLFLTMAVWILVGPAVGFITRNLLARSDKPNRKAAIIDGCVYGVIFFFTACALSSGIKTNAALIFSIIAGFLMIVPIARSLTAFNVAKARHKELNETSDQVLIYGLLILPALLPALAFAHVCGLSDSLTLFLINFITFDFVLIVALSMIASADEFIPEEAQEAAKVAEQPEAVAEEAAPAPVEEPAPAMVEEPIAEPIPEPIAEEVPEPIEEPPPTEPKPEKVGSGNPDDPIIQFLNSQDGADEKPAAPAKPAARNAPRVAPPRKPGSPNIKPPKKPGSAPAANAPAPNAPSRLKAPAKPKKRF